MCGATGLLKFEPGDPGKKLCQNPRKRKGKDGNDPETPRLRLWEVVFRTREKNCRQINRLNPKKRKLVGDMSVALVKNSFGRT